MQTFLGAPIVLRGIPYGNLYLAEKGDGEAFSAEDVDSVGTSATGRARCHSLGGENPAQST
jgi:hypothetical protein